MSTNKAAKKKAPKAAQEEAAPESGLDDLSLQALLLHRKTGGASVEVRDGSRHVKLGAWISLPMVISLETALDALLRGLALDGDADN